MIENYRILAHFRDDKDGKPYRCLCLREGAKRVDIEVPTEFCEWIEKVLIPRGIDMFFVRKEGP